jgi:hypothetical protein
MTGLPLSGSATHATAACRCPRHQCRDPERVGAAGRYARIPGDLPVRDRTGTAGGQELRAGRQCLGDLQASRAGCSGVPDLDLIGKPVARPRGGLAVADADLQPRQHRRLNSRQRVLRSGGSRRRSQAGPRKHHARDAHEPGRPGQAGPRSPGAPHDRLLPRKPMSYRTATDSRTMCAPGQRSQALLPNDMWLYIPVRDLFNGESVSTSGRGA